jgi:hypothetical protein
VAWRGVAWRGVAWRGVAWRGVAWRGVAWRGVVWCGVVWWCVVERECGWTVLVSSCVVRCGVVWHGVTWCGTVHVLGGADPSVGLSVDEATLSSPSSTHAPPGGVGVPPSDDMPVDVC